METLESLVTPDIAAHIHFSTVAKASWSTTRAEWLLIDDSGRALGRSKHLVVSIGFEPDSSILDNLRTVRKTRDSTVLIKGFSDTANMYISRLMLNNNKV